MNYHFDSVNDQLVVGPMDNIERWQEGWNPQLFLPIVVR
jgi:hypothetical protein